MRAEHPNGTTLKGRRFSASELELVTEVVVGFPGLSRQELAKTICELLDWRRPQGGLKTWECKELLGKLEEQGLFQLPDLRQTKPQGAATRVVRTPRSAAQKPLNGTVRDVAPVHLKPVRTAEERQLWRELVDRYHYLGHKVPFGAHLRYLIEVSQPPQVVVGCLQVSSPAWRIAVRDAWVGWSDPIRQRNLQRIVNQSRFLLLPWVQVRNLASHVLALLTGRLIEDWPAAYGMSPLLMETLVDSRRYSGTCYQAAGWLCLGVTQGRGRMDAKHQRHGASPKTVFVKPLVARAREALREI